MATLQNKTNAYFEIDVIEGDGKKKGHFSLTEMNLYYFRKSGTCETARYTYHQLMELIEDDIKNKLDTDLQNE